MPQIAAVCTFEAGIFWVGVVGVVEIGFQAVFLGY